MTSSSDVAQRAGVSRSTVSQIFNGHEHRFSADTVERVRQVAQGMGYRPSLAGRTLVRGTSDIVLTLVPNITFGPRLRELIDVVTNDLAKAGLVNLLRIAEGHEAVHDAVLGLRPFGVISLAPLPPEQKERLEAQGIPIVEQTAQSQKSIDEAIGRLQAKHLASAGYDTIVVAAPTDPRERTIAPPRTAGVRAWCKENQVNFLPPLAVEMAPGGPAAAISQLPRKRIGIAAYNDDVALAILLALQHAGWSVPSEVGIIGVDNTPIAQLSIPTLTTVDFDLVYSAHEIVRTVLNKKADQSLSDMVDEVEERLTVVPGGSTLASSAHS